MQQYSAYILVGGQSRRMGTNKAMVLLNDRPLLSYALDTLQQLSLEITLVGNEVPGGGFGKRIISDAETGKGPAAAIDAALQDTASEYIFITSCDMPFIRAEAVQQILTLSNGHSITVPGTADCPEPMFSVYHKSCKQKWHDLLLRGIVKLSDFFLHFDTNFVDRRLFNDIAPHLFHNVNTPGDLQNAHVWMNN